MSSGTLGSERARDALDPAMHLVATVIEVAGVAIIVVGVLIASALFLRRGPDRVLTRATRARDRDLHLIWLS